MKKQSTKYITTFVIGAILGSLLTYIFLSHALNQALNNNHQLEKKQSSSESSSINFTKIGTTFDFSLNDIEEKNFTLSKLKGKVVILHFYSTSCSQCQISMPQLVELYNEKKDYLEIVSISIFPSYDTNEIIISWKENWGSDWIYLRDTEIPPVSQLYVVRATPTYVIIDPEGNTIYRQIGGELSQLKEIVERLKPD